MKSIAQSIIIMGFVLLATGCSTASKAPVDGVNGVCENPKCQCPKPCQCGAGCKCGTGSNPTDMGAK